MIIRPVTDLRNHFPDVEADLREAGHVFLTKNGYGTAVLLDINEFIELTGQSVSLPSAVRRSDTGSSGRGFLNKYADSDLMLLEKEAGRLHAMKKYGPADKEVLSDDE